MARMMLKNGTNAFLRKRPLSSIIVTIDNNNYEVSANIQCSRFYKNNSNPAVRALIANEHRRSPSETDSILVPKLVLLRFIVVVAPAFFACFPEENRVL